MNIEKVVIKLFALMVDVHTAEIGLVVAPQLYHNEQTKTWFAEHCLHLACEAQLPVQLCLHSNSVPCWLTCQSNIHRSLFLS